MVSIAHLRSGPCAVFRDELNLLGPARSHYDYKEMANKAFCQLCSLLHEPRTHHQWYRDIDAWYDGGNHCHKPNRFKVPIKQFNFANYTIPAETIAKIPLS